MSAFVVDPETMDRCVRAICARGQYGQVTDLFAGIVTSAEASPTEIGRRLYTLNVDAVQQRYPDTLDHPEDMPGPCEPIPAAKLPHLYTYNGGRKPVDFDGAVACLKSLHCLKYQCSEGDADKSDTFKALATFIGVFANHLIQSLPAYNRAPWG